MFKLQPNPTFTSKVPLSIPGEPKPATITVTFKHLSRPKIKEFFNKLEGKADVEALGEIIVGWEGPDAPYNEESLQALLDNYPASAAELFEAFRADLMESRRKN